MSDGAQSSDWAPFFLGVEMATEEVVRKARLSMKIDGRYWYTGDRRDWTPKQKRRMRKKRRKHGLSLYDMHF